MSIDLQKIGQFLKKKREEQKLTIGEVSNVLCLRKPLIEAIESGNWDVLPHQVYVKGYIKEYAGLLKVYDELAPSLVEKTKSDDIIIDIPKPKKPKTVHRKLSKASVIYPVIITLLVGFFIFDKIQRDQVLTSKLENADHITAKPSNIATTDSSDKKNIPDIVDARRLMITCHERAWVSVVIDGAEKKEFMLNPQEIIMLNAKEKFDLLIGNAGGVKLFLNGKDIEFTGKSGEVKRIKVS